MKGLKFVTVLIVSLCLGMTSPLMAANKKFHAKELLAFQVVQTQFALSKKSIQKITLSKAKDGKTNVNVFLTPQAAKAMYYVTSKSVGKHMSIVWNNRVVTSPVIRTPIGAKFVISGFTAKEAANLVKSLKG